MVEASNTFRHRVLHIRPQPPAWSEAGPRPSPIDDLLTGLPLETEWCGDVYRGLAGLLRPSSDPPKAVIVCLDGLGTQEFEFFTIVSKHRRDLKVFVYAAARAESRIAKAVELGAKGPLTREILAELANGGPVPMTVKTPAGESERVADKPVSLVMPTAASEPTRIDEEDARKPARVPWLRYGDRPARVAPPHREPPPQTLDLDPQTQDPPRSYEPLLTDEEFLALMNEDIAAFSQDDSDTRRPDDDEEMRGVL